MDKVKWKKEYSSGLVYLDNHRRNYLEIVNELIDIHNSGNCLTRLPIVFHRLAFYIEDYFTKKEMAIREAPMISLKSFKDEHRRFTVGISCFQERFSQGDADICPDMIRFMMDWFLDYLRSNGPEVYDYLRSKGYE